MKTLDIYITDVCNLNCDYCYVDVKKRESTSIDSTQFIERVDLLNYDIIKFYGGEPLVRYKEILEIVQAVRRKKPKMQFTVLTNGILLTKKILQDFNDHNISIGISLHKEVVKGLFNKKKLSLLSQYIHRIGFFILIEYGKERVTYDIVHFLSSLGFTKFTLNPITSDDWKSLDNLKKVLDDIYILFENNDSLEIEESSWNSLKNLHDGGYCKKKQVDKLGNYKACNRFDHIDFLENPDNINFIDNIFEREFSFSSHPKRWFFVCNKGWYLDNFGPSLNYDVEKVHHFFHLNLMLIDFFKRLAYLRGRINFLSRDIQEIRFNITNQCNLRCNYCYLDFNNDVIDISTAKNIIDYLISQDGNQKTIAFFGGEPLLQFDLVKELTEYASDVFRHRGKKINFKIATNFLLSNKDIYHFFSQYDFNIHVSFNGNLNNDTSRDSSTKKLFQKINNYIQDGFDISKITLLYVIFPHSIQQLKNDILKIQDMGFTNIHLEMYIGKKYRWHKVLYKVLFHSINDIINSGILTSLSIDNIKKTDFNNVYLDISTEGVCSDNSLDFFQDSNDFKPKKMLDKIISLSHHQKINQ